MSTYSNIQDPGRDPRRERILRFLYNLIWILAALCIICTGYFALCYAPAAFFLMISSAALLFALMIFEIVYNSK